MGGREGIVEDCYLNYFYGDLTQFWLFLRGFDLSKPEKGKKLASAGI